MSPIHYETVVLDLGIFGTVDCEIGFYYTPAERATRDEPGCDEEYEIDTITFVSKRGGVYELTALPLSKKAEQIIINQLKECRE